MATLLGSLTQTVTPQLTEQIGKMISVENSQVTEGVNMAAPLMLAAIGQKASAPNGADEMLDSLTEDVGNPFDAVASGQSDATLNQLFGIGAKKVASWIENTTGLNIAPFLPLVAPLVMNALQNAVKSQNLDGVGLSTLLQNENAAYAKANPQLASEINAALDAGQNVNERAARIRARFTNEEWNTLAKTPTLAGYAVMMSSLSGPVGLSKEINALLEDQSQFRASAEPDSLVGLISRAMYSPDQIAALGANRSNAIKLTRDACLEVVKILNEKETHDEIIAYKQFVVDVATHVASAAIDGGIMSIGGKPIDDDEKMTLDLIAAALAYQP